jgi:hypothetical protein
MNRAAINTVKTPTSTSAFVNAVHGVSKDRKNITLGEMYSGIRSESGAVILDDAQTRQNDLVGVTLSSAMELLVLEGLRGHFQNPHGYEILRDAGVLDARKMVAIKEVERNEIINLLNGKGSTKNVDTQSQYLLQALKSKGVLAKSSAFATPQEIANYNKTSVKFTGAWDDYERDLAYWRRYGEHEDECPVQPDKNPLLANDGIDYSRQPEDPRITKFKEVVAQLPVKDKVTGEAMPLVQVSDPGVKLKISAVRKLSEKYKQFDMNEMQLDASSLKDMNRIGVSLLSAGLVEDYNGIMQQNIAVLNPSYKPVAFRAEAWGVTKTGYMDRKSYVTLPVKNKENAYGMLGTVAEVKLDIVPLKRAYRISHHLYDVARLMENNGQLDLKRFDVNVGDHNLQRAAQELRSHINKEIEISKDFFNRDAERYFGKGKYSFPDVKIGDDVESVKTVHDALMGLHRQLYVDAINQTTPNTRYDYLRLAALKEGEINAGKSPDDPSWVTVLSQSLRAMISDIPHFFSYQHVAGEAAHKSKPVMKSAQR